MLPDNFANFDKSILLRWNNQIVGFAAGRSAPGVHQNMVITPITLLDHGQLALIALHVCSSADS